MTHPIVMPMPMPTAPTPVLSIDALSFSYPHRHVFTRWSAQIAPGLSWLKGGNGSGKSTLLKLLAGALIPAHGRLVLLGLDSGQHPEQALAYKRQVFWCGPDRIAFEHLTPWEYWGFLRTLYASFDEARLRALLPSLGLMPHVHRPLRELSTGTQRKVWVLAALCAGTGLTLMDEPLNALDTRSLACIRQALEDCAIEGASSGRAWLLTSHEDIGPASAHAHVLNLDEASSDGLVAALP